MIASTEENAVPSPKRKASRKGKSYDIYPYYAAYDSGFAHAALQLLSRGRAGHVLDPWNGSGTTTTVAANLGYDVTGVDLNPAMHVVAKARLCQSQIAPVQSLPEVQELDDDPLHQWFTGDSVAVLRRAVAWAIGGPRCINSAHDLQELTATHCLQLVALFRIARRLVRRVTSNPTWTVANPEERGSFNSDDLIAALNAEVSKLGERPMVKISNAILQFVINDSRKLPIDEASIDYILTSPPYCTRIDYAVATRVELAIMGPHFFSALAERQMRGKMLGTTTIEKRATSLGLNDIPIAWGETCKTFLSALFSHGSYASRSYYFPNHYQYFKGLSDSYLEIARVLAPGGAGAIVVQDSWYKDIRNDLAQISAEMLQGVGLRVTSITHYQTRAGLASVHRHVAKSMGSHTRTESVIYLEK